MPGNLDLALRIRADLGNAKRTLDTLERELKQVGGAGRTAATQTGAAARGVDRVATAADRSSRRLDRATRSVGRLEGASGRAARRLSGLYLALGGIGAVQAVRGIAEAGLEIEALEQRFTFAAGSIAAGARELAFVRQEADRLGISFNGAAQGYSSLAAASRGTNIGIEETREIFLGIAEAATVLRLDAGQLQGALTAVEQIISKGKVTAEELRGQLGERLPGAVQIMARALGIGTQELDKMLEQGQLTSDALVPFARQLREDFADSIPDAADSAAASFARLGNAIERLQQSIATSGLLDWLAQVTDRLTDAVDKAERLGPAVSAIFGGERDTSGPSSLVEEIEALARTDPGAAAERVAELEDTMAAASRRVTELRAELAALGEPGLVDVDFFSRRELTTQLALAESVFQAIVRQVADARDVLNDAELDRLRAAATPAAGGDFQAPAPPDRDAEARQKAEERANQQIERLRERHQNALARIGADGFERIERDRLEAQRRIDALEAAGADPEAVIDARLAAELRFSREASALAGEQLRDFLEVEGRRRQALRETRRAALADLEAIERGLLEPYPRAIAEVEHWRASTIAAFEAAGLSAAEYGATVDREVSERLAEAADEEAERRLRASRHWRDGAVRALKDYADQAGDAGAQAENAIVSAAQAGEDAFARFATGSKVRFSDLTNSIVSDLARIAYQRNILGPIASALFDGLGGGFLGGSGIQGPGGAGPSNFRLFHAGGTAGAGGGTRRYGVPPAVFARAPRYHAGGIAGLSPDEVPAILRRGETVRTPEQERGLVMRPSDVRVEIIPGGTPQQVEDVEIDFDLGATVIRISVNDIETGGPLGRAIAGIAGRAL